MKNGKKIIDIYKNDIYFVDLVVANQYVELKDLQKQYIYSDGVELDEFIMHGCATICNVIRKSDDCYCLLVKYNKPWKGRDKKLDLINTVSHESAHVALNIYEKIGQKVRNCGSEPFCYLVGWASECIYNTLTKKTK